MSRWQLYDPVEDETLVFANNPFAMTSMAQGHATKSAAASPVNGRVRTFRAPDKPFTWSFNGKVRTSADYAALLAWVNRPNRLELTDHLGRVHDVLGQKFSPTPVEKSASGNDWLFAYTIDCLYFRRIS